MIALIAFSRFAGVVGNPPRLLLFVVPVFAPAKVLPSLLSARHTPALANLPPARLLPVHLPAARLLHAP